uniref:Adenylyl cyclase class-3/4/guanylyl cyclase n=1 Tax=Mycobacterium sp. (strain JLS) TaxID=164757 RepID=A0A5Q5CCZ5_MYCSJ
MRYHTRWAARCHDIEVHREGVSHGSDDRRRDLGGGSIDELLDRAVAAINRGDRATATVLTAQVLEADGANAEAEDLLAVPDHPGEIRRLTILFADLVDSTSLSTRVEPETYRLVVGRYREQVVRIVERFGGHVCSTKGDGLLAVFGHPIAHEDDARRAVAAGLDITGGVARISEAARRRFGFDIAVRVGVHRGPVYLDTEQDDVYGLAANLAARVSGLAPPDSVVVSDAVAPLITRFFQMESRPPAAVKGVEKPVAYYRVTAERPEPIKLTRGPLVGRDEEVALLRENWACAQAGSLSMGMVFRGEAGIGKSRLAAAAVEVAERSGAVVLELAGSEFHADVGLYAVRVLIERRCGIERLSAPTERIRLLGNEINARGLDPATVLPLLAPVLGIAPQHGYQPVPAEGAKLQELIDAAVHQYLKACLGEEAALVVAEDLHWVDSASLAALGGLLRANPGSYLVVMTGRPDGWTGEDWPVTTFDLAPLTDAQTDELVDRLEPGASAAQKAAIRQRCDGIPFYVEQVVAGLTETGVPETLYEPLFARLRASANAIPVLEAAAVIGRHIDRGLLCSVVDLSVEELDDVIEELEGALVLERWGSDGWRFRHELLREVAAELAPESVRRGLHAKVADALSGDADWRLVAGHFERAERFREAASAYQRASNDARRRGALAEARTHLTQALGQLDRATPGPERDRQEMAARLRRGVLISVAEGYQSRAAAGDFERCLQLGGTDLGDDELFATLTALGNYCLARADLGRAAEVVKSLRAGLAKRQWFRPAVDMLVGLLACLRGEFELGCSSLEAATVGVAAGHHDVVAVWRFVPNEPVTSAHIHLALVALVRGDLRGAERELSVSADRAERLRFPQGPYMHAWELFVATWLRIEAGQLARAATLAAELRGVAEWHGFDIWRQRAAFLEAAVGGLAALDTEDVDTAKAMAHTATATTLLDELRTLEANMYSTFYDAVLGRLLIAVDQSEQAHARLSAGLALAEDTEMHFYDSELLRLRAQTHTDHTAIQADLHAARELARCQGAPLFELRAALDDFVSRGESARAALVAAVDRIPAESAMPDVARARATLTLSNTSDG